MRTGRDTDDGLAVPNIMGHHRSRASRRSRTNPNWCDEHRVATDKRAVADNGLELVVPIVVGRDDSRANVDVLSDRDIAEIGKVADPYPGPMAARLISAWVPIRAPASRREFPRISAYCPTCTPSPRYESVTVEDPKTAPSASVAPLRIACGPTVQPRPILVPRERTDPANTVVSAPIVTPASMTTVSGARIATPLRMRVVVGCALRSAASASATLDAVIYTCRSLRRGGHGQLPASGHRSHQRSRTASSTNSVM